MSDNEKIIDALTQMGAVSKQLELIADTMRQNHTDTMRRIDQNHADTNRRIDDLHHAQNNRIASVEGRVGTLEQNERSTAIKAGIAGAASGLIAAAGIATIKLLK